MLPFSGAAWYAPKSEKGPIFEFPFSSFDSFL
jgi:hypothetical protein